MQFEQKAGRQVQVASQRIHAPMLANFSHSARARLFQVDAPNEFANWLIWLEGLGNTAQEVAKDNIELRLRNRSNKISAKGKQERPNVPGFRLRLRWCHLVASNRVIDSSICGAPT